MVVKEPILKTEAPTDQVLQAFFDRPFAELDWPRPHYRRIIKNGSGFDPGGFLTKLTQSFFYDPLNHDLLVNAGIDPSKTQTKKTGLKKWIPISPYVKKRTDTVTTYVDYPKLVSLIRSSGLKPAAGLLMKENREPIKAKAANRDLQMRLIAIRVLDVPLEKENKQAVHDQRDAQIDSEYAEQVLQIAEQILSSSPPNLMPIEEDDYAFCNSPKLYYFGFRDKDDIGMYERELETYRFDMKQKADMIRDQREMLQSRVDWVVKDHIVALHTRLKSEMIGTLGMLPEEYQGRVNDILIRNIANIENEDVAVEAVDQIARYWNFYTQRELAGFERGDRRYSFDPRPVNILLEIVANDKRPEVIRRTMHALESVTTPLDGVHNLKLDDPYELTNSADFIAAAPEITRTIVAILRNNTDIINDESNGRRNYTTIVDYGMRYIRKLLAVATTNNGQETIVLTDKNALRVQILAVKAVIQAMENSNDKTNCLGAITEVLDNFFT